MASPGPYRCQACGNRTRFEVTTLRRTRSFHHYSLAGEPTVQEEETLLEVIEDVTCRWCASARDVVAGDGRPAKPGGSTT